MNSAFTATLCYRFHHRLLVLKKKKLFNSLQDGQGMLGQHF